MVTVVHTESSMGWGGQEIRIFTELVHLSNRGYRVGLICQPGSAIGFRAKGAGIRTWEVKFRRPFGTGACLKVYRILREEGAGVLNTHSSRDSWTASVAARIAGIPVVRTRHLSVPVSRNPLSRLVYSSLCDRIVTTGERIRQLLVQQIRLDPARVIAIPTGVALDVFDPTRVNGKRFKRSLDLEADIPLMGMVAVLRSWKGHRIFLEAVPLILEKVPRARFLIVGEGPQHGNIQRWIEQMGLKNMVVLAGHREDTPEVLAALDVVISASTAAEGVPQTLIQALAMERPVVATDVGGVGEIIRDGETGLLIPPHDPQGMARAVVTLLNEPAKATAMALAGRRLVERDYTLETMLQKMEALYEQLLKKGRDGGNEAPPLGMTRR